MVRTQKKEFSDHAAALTKQAPSFWLLKVQASNIATPTSLLGLSNTSLPCLVSETAGSFFKNAFLMSNAMNLSKLCIPLIFWTHIHPAPGLTLLYVCAFYALKALERIL